MFVLIVFSGVLYEVRVYFTGNKTLYSNKLHWWLI